MNEVRIFSPATVANVSCGFDVLGFCLDTIGDEMVVRKTIKKGLKIVKIEGYDLPYAIEKNVAGVSAQALYEDAQPDFGFEIEIYKSIKPGSGIGSSAASAAGSVYAMNVLLDNKYTTTELTAFAMKGEALASNTEHADNIAPALFGGFTLVKSLNPLKILQIPTPTELYATVIHPQIEIKTSESRALLPHKVALQKAVTQWSNVGSLIHALHCNDYKLIGESLQDVIVEPLRSTLIPEFDAIKSIAEVSGTLGSGISGSGPSIFCLSQGKETAQKIGHAIASHYKKTTIEFEIYVSKINTRGMKLISHQ